MDEENYIEEVDCPVCGGTGEIITPAYEERGKIIDSVVEKCPCTLIEDFEE